MTTKLSTELVGKILAAADMALQTKAIIESAETKIRGLVYDAKSAAEVALASKMATVELLGIARSSEAIKSAIDSVRLVQFQANQIEEMQREIAKLKTSVRYEADAAIVNIRQSQDEALERISAARIALRSEFGGS